MSRSVQSTSLDLGKSAPRLLENFFSHRVRHDFQSNNQNRVPTVKNNEPRFKIPHVQVLIAALLVITALASIVLPAGSYERDERGRVVAGTFQYDSANAEADGPERPQGWALMGAVLTAPLEGIVAASSVIAFLLIIGGAFKVVDRTGAFEAAIRAGVARMAGVRWLVVPVSMLIFSMGGAVFGLGEEIIPFVLLMVPMVQALGYHPMVGVAIPLIGSQVGFAGAMINPFTVGIAQGIAELPPLSGWQYRTLIWLVVTFVGIVYVERRSRSLKQSDTEVADETTAEESQETLDHEMATSLEAHHVRVLAVLVLGIGVMLWGVQEYQWYVLEIGAVFLAIGVAAGVVGRLSANGIAEGFVAGARDLVSAALVVGTARGIVVLAQKVGILDTVLYGVAGGLEGLPGVVALNLMFFFQTCLNFFIPSGSGQAALTMPIMVPLAELVGLTRQMSVLAFQLGDGFSNIIIPTSAVLMGSLEAGKVPYERWFAFVWPLQVILLGCGVLALVGAVAIGFGP